MRMPHALHRVALATLLTLTSAAADAQTLEPRPFPTLGISSFTFDSPSMGVKYDVSVWVPPSFNPEGGKKLPLLIVTDGNLAFTVSLDAARSLINQGDIGEMIVASIGTPPEDGEKAFVRRRVYEFSPPDWDMADPFGVVVKRTCGEMGAPPDRCVGGAPRFLGVINHELIPMLARQFAVDTTQLGLFGVSAGGFFASYVVFHPESRFTRYIIQSPAMAYGGDAIHDIEARYAESHKDLAASIYMASGTLEMNDPFLEGIGHIVSGQARLGAALTSRNYPGLTLRSEMLQGLGHGDAAGTALVLGMRFLYEKPGGAGVRTR